MTLELAEAGRQLQYIKVTNPENPREFLYVESNYLEALKREIGLSEGDETLGDFFGNLWNGVKGAVGGLITSGGNPLGAISGAIVGFTQNNAKKPTAAVSQNAQGQSVMTVTAPGNLTPAVIAPPPAPQKTDFTPIYISLAALAGLYLVTKK